MNLETMKVFCDLVETGSFSKAAEANYISQSAVSQQLAKLEREFSAQLISRGGGLLAATEAGTAFYKGAKEIIRRHERLTGEVRSAASSIRGVLRVGTIYSVGFYLLDPYVRRFLAKHPEVNLHVEYTQCNRIYAAVIGGEMDLGVVACGQKQRSVEIIRLTDEKLVAVLPPDHRLARRREVRLTELAGEKFVAFEGNIPTRRHIDKMLKREKIKVNITLEFDNIELVKRAIMAGNGVGILPADSVERETAYGDLASAKLGKTTQDWTRPVGIVRRRGKTPTPAERMFLGLLRGRARPAGAAAEGGR